MRTIPNVIPSWAIDWVNKIFTLPNPIIEIVDAVFDWVEYFDFTFSWNTITLDDAPTATFRVDYVTSWTWWAWFAWTWIIVSEARTLLEDALDYWNNMWDVTDSLFLTWCQQADDLFYPILRRLNAYKYYSKDTITTVVDTANYSLPVDFENISDPKTGIYNTDDNWNITNTVLTETWLWSTDEWYYLEWVEIFITPTPKTIKIYKLVYMPTLIRLADTTSATVVEQQFSEALTNFLKKKFYMWDENPWAASDADQEFANNLNQMQTNTRTSTRGERVRNNNNIY